MNRSIAGFILYIGTALYLLTAGVAGIFFKGGEIYGMVGTIFGGGNLTTIIAIIFSLAVLVAGALLLLQLFGMEFGIIEPILFAFAILWIVFIVVGDILKGGSLGWDWLRNLAFHLMILGVIASGTRAFGGN
jgi:hypothetical protein